MINIPVLNNVIDFVNEKEKIIAKDVLFNISVNPMDIHFISPLYCKNTKLMYKRKCLIKIRDIGDFIVKLPIEKMKDLLKPISKPIGYGNRNN